MDNQRSNISLWFLHNPTAANLLMWVFVIGGLIAIFTMRQEVFPNMVLDTIVIQAEYRGATASEVEEQVVRPMEQSIDTLRDIRTVVSEVYSGGAEIYVMLDDGADVQRARQEIRNSLEGLNTLPADLDPPKITQLRDTGAALDIGFYGFASQADLHAFANKARERLLQLPLVGQVEVSGAGEPEISIWVTPERTRLLGLSLTGIANRILASSFELSGGEIRSATGNFGLSTGNERRYSDDYAGIALAESASGEPLTLSQVARIEEGFRPQGTKYLIDGTMGVLMSVYSIGSVSPTQVSESVRSLLDDISAEMAPNGGTVILDDDAKSYADRVGVLAESAIIGLILVLLLLFFVLEARIALWVAAGLPLALLGGVALFALTPYTINFVSIFAFVIVIGVVVDDAVVIGESIYAGIQQGKTPLLAATETLDRFSGAITLAIATNIIAFMPVFFMPGQVGLFLLAIPVVTTCVFAVSLIEALWILPSHLAYAKPIQSHRSAKAMQRRFEVARDHYFVPWMRQCLHNRGLVIATGVSIAMMIFCYAISGRVAIALQPVFESHEVSMDFSLAPGASERQVFEMAQRIEAQGYRVISRIGNRDEVTSAHIALATPSSHQGSITFTLIDPEQRGFTTEQFAQQWSREIGQPAQLTQLSVDYLQGPGGGRELTIELAHADESVSRAAAEQLVRRLHQITGVEQISYSGNAFRPEINMQLNAAGRALGFDESVISSQIRAQLDGLEATRFTRGVDEVRVMVRGDALATGSLPDLSQLVLISSDGKQAALGDIAHVHWGRGPVQLRRINGQRIERIEASIDQKKISKSLVEDFLSDNILPELETQFPGLTTWDEAIDTDEDGETATSLLIATFAVLAAIFVLIAAFARSSRYGAIIMLSIPLSAAGAFLGHYVLGEAFSAGSFLGVLALAGLVINAALLLHLRYNEGLQANETPIEAMATAVSDRFRPIVLSSVTTLLGLAPLIISGSVQAAPLRPVAISMGFGMLFSIPVVLVLLPCIIVALEPRTVSRQHLWNRYSTGLKDNQETLQEDPRGRVIS